MTEPRRLRAAIAAEDGKFCSHDGFDRAAIMALLASAERQPRILEAIFNF